MGFGIGFQLMSILVPVVFIIVLAGFITVFVKNIINWNKNNHSPRLSADAVIVSKRIDVTHHHGGNSSDVSHGHDFSSTRYYVTFQFESTDRMELSVSGYDFGMLAEGDRGKLSFQGTRYLGFERS